MTDFDLDELREKAEWCMPRSWTISPVCGSYGAIPPDDDGESVWHDGGEATLVVCRVEEGSHPWFGTPPDLRGEEISDEEFARVTGQRFREFIAAADPSTVLALIDRVEELERAILSIASFHFSDSFLDQIAGSAPDGVIESRDEAEEALKGYLKELLGGGDDA